MSDTTAESRTLQDQILSRMAPEERFALACSMSMTTRELALARLRREHPDWDSARLVAELVGLTLPSHCIPPQFR